ncbi:MAG: hypothetical protein R2774_06530 [Saprospiraceae bacterium]
MFYKTIIQGRIEFGTQKSFDMVTKMYLQRVETYYKTDVILKFEEIFNAEELSLVIPRHVAQITDKAYRTTTGLLKYCTQFAVAGSIRAWLISEGEVLHFDIMEPSSDKAAVQSFVKGTKLVKVKGKENEAIQALTQAIDKYDRHAQAYERRAKVNFIMRNFHDALRDYNKSINIDPSIPSSFYGKAKILIMKDELVEAIQNLEETIKKSIALQPIYWKARRLKAECHIKLGEWSKAEFDLKLFTKRKFEPDNQNYFWRRWAFYNYGLVLVELNELIEAIKSFDKALELPNINDGIEEAEILFARGQTRAKAGKPGHVKDLKEAANKGSAKAKAHFKSAK